MSSYENATFQDAVVGLHRGDFSRLQPLYIADPNPNDHRAQILRWFDAGLFANEPKALAEALTCACFLGHTSVAEVFLTNGVDPAAGTGTGMSALHWAANRGQLGAVRLLLRHNAPLELRNQYDGTVLGCTVWSIIHEPRGDQMIALGILLESGANAKEAGYPTGHKDVDELLRRYGAGFD